MLKWKSYSFGILKQIPFGSWSLVSLLLKFSVSVLLFSSGACRLLYFLPNVWNFIIVCLSLNVFWSILLSEDFTLWKLMTFGSGKFSWIICLVIFRYLFLLFIVFSLLITVNLEFPASNFLLFFLLCFIFSLVHCLLTDFNLIIQNF